VIDFGLAHPYEIDSMGKVLKPAMLRETCGSKSYAAPEVLGGRGYDGFPADVWSCGISLFAMLAGFFPLDEATSHDWRFEKVKAAASNGLSATRTIFSFYDRACSFSRHVVELIDGMLSVQPENRLLVQEVLQSSWLNEKVPCYRGDQPATAEDRESIIAALTQASLNEPTIPNYRKADLSSVPAERRMPPLLSKQPQLFCADFHLEEL
jgi:serine/threonine protein kinase